MALRFAKPFICCRRAIARRDHIQPFVLAFVCDLAPVRLLAPQPRADEAFVLARFLAPQPVAALADVFALDADVFAEVFLPVVVVVIRFTSFRLYYERRAAKIDMSGAAWAQVNI